MKILMLCHRLPYPPVKGEKIRAFHHLRALAAKHEVTLVTLVDDPSDLVHVDTLKRWATRVQAVAISPRWAKARSLLALPLGRSMSLEYFRTATLRRRVRACLAETAYDLVFVYSSAMAQYVMDVESVPIVMDIVDMDSQKYAQYAHYHPFPFSTLYRLESRRMRAFERAIAGRARTNILVSPAEAALFRANAPGARADVLPVGIDTEYFAPADAPADGPPTVVFTGVMDYFPNVDAVQYFTREIFPRIRRREPRARFVVVGQRPSAVVRRLGQLPGVEVTGQVPDVRPYLAAARVSVAPFRLAQGMQTKVLEAMAMARPVVVTSKAHRGLGAKPGEHLFVADDPGAFADTVVRLLHSPGLRTGMGRAARRFVEAHHSHAELGSQLERLLAEAGGKPAAAPSLEVL